MKSGEGGESKMKSGKDGYSGPLTRSRVKAAGNLHLHEPFSIPKKTYPYLKIKEMDKKSGYPINRFCYERTGHRIYFVRREDMPKEVEFPAWATEEAKAAGMNKYPNLQFHYLPDDEKSDFSKVKRYYYVSLSRDAEASAIPELINWDLWMLLLNVDDD